MAACKSKKKHFSNPGAAKQRLREIQEGPIDPTRLYQPTGVVRCHCNGWVLTSNLGKQWKKGKSSRDRRLR
jgi:hypothetical protein